MGSVDNSKSLMELARRGDQAAMSRLAELYESEVRIVARVHLGAPLRPYFDSLDLVQSVHRSILVGLRADKYEIASPEKLIALAATMIRRKIAREWRRAKRQTRTDPRPQDSTAPANSLVHLSAASTDPQASVALRDQVSHLLLLVSTVDRRLIELRLDGYTTAEAARELRLDADVCRVRLSRLRQRLKRIGVMEELV